MLLIRPYQTPDLASLAAVYKNSVLEIGATAYEPEQIAVWASSAGQLATLSQKLSQGLTLVALENNQVVAFGQLAPLNHIALLYTSPTHARQGYGTKIYQKLESYAVRHGICCLYVEASRIARHFFAKMGFSLVEVELVERKGLQFERFRMEKVIV